MDYTQSNKDGHVNVIMSGQFTFTDHEKFREIIDMIKDGGVKSLSLDFKDVDFIDSAALGMLLVAREEGQNSSLAIVLQNIGSIEKMLKVAKFDTLFAIKNE